MLDACVPSNLLTDDNSCFRLLVESIDEYAIFMVDKEGIILTWNSGAEHINGYPAADIIGKHFSCFYTENDKDMKYPQRNLALAKELGFYKESQLRVKNNGILFWAEVLITVLYKNQKHIGFGIVTRDITERIDKEKELERYTAELARSNKVLEEFAYVTSHDLKAPLRVIDNTSQWLEEDLAEYLTSENRETIQLLRKRVHRMEKFLDDLLEYSRVGRVKDARFSEEINCRALLDEIIFLLAPNPNFTINIDPAISLIAIKRMPLQQVFHNLIHNAIKHHDKIPAQIDITVSLEKNKYHFCIKDNGPGIPRKFHERAFQMFQTLKPRDQVEGSGMGLAIVKRIIDVTENTLLLDSEEGNGAAFYFTWFQ